MLAFLSYQTKDKKVAGAVREILKNLGVDTFLAHEDISVSAAWQRRIIREIKRCEIFVAILSKQYLSSPYCMQESGIAVFRGNITIIPLAIDKTTTSPGFMQHIQSVRITPRDIDRSVLFDGLIECAPDLVLKKLTDELGRSHSFRDAEANFRALKPYLEHATDSQIVRVLKVSAANGQVWNAHLCREEYLPPLFKSHGKRLDVESRRVLRNRGVTAVSFYDFACRTRPCRHDGAWRSGRDGSEARSG